MDFSAFHLSDMLNDMRIQFHLVNLKRLMRKWSCLVSRCYPRICLEELRKT